MTKSFKTKPLLIDSQPESGASFLFDWKTALCHNYLIFNAFFIASLPATCFNLSQLFPLWKPLNQKQTDVQYVQKMHTLISKMETTEIAHE
jgi:hypothetical protein